jgi:hypothetical protein
MLHLLRVFRSIHNAYSVLALLQINVLLLQGDLDYQLTGYTTTSLLRSALVSREGLLCTNFNHFIRWKQCRWVLSSLNSFYPIKLL